MISGRVIRYGKIIDNNYRYIDCFSFDEQKNRKNMKVQSNKHSSLFENNAIQL